MRPAIETLRFLSELVMVAGLAVAGWAASPVVAFVLPTAAVVVWGSWVAPKARRRLADPVRLVVELAVFTVTAAALVVAGYAAAGVALGTVAAALAVALRLVGSTA